MIPAEILLGFFAIAIAMAIVPGPDNLFVLTQSAAAGARAGLLVVLGLCTGLLVHSALVAFGVTALILATPAAFVALQLTGAGYLLYLAWRAFTAPVPTAPPDPAGLPTPAGLLDSDRAAPHHAAPPGAPTAAALYRRGMIMNMTNPKVVVFFLALFPQFTDPTRGPIAPQIAALGALVILATLLVFGSIALLAGTLATRWLRGPEARAALNWLAGAVCLALAMNIIFDILW